MRGARPWIPFAIVATAIFLFSTDWLTAKTMETAVVPLESDRGAELRWIFRKTNHIIAFFLLGLTTFPLLRRRTLEGDRLGFIYCALIAVISEVFQFVTASRTPQFSDVVINMAGSAAGVRLLFYRPLLTLQSRIGKT